MEIKPIQQKHCFQATISKTGDFKKIVKDSAEQGMSKRYINLLVNKIHEYFPQKNCFIYFDNKYFDKKSYSFVNSVTIEMKNPKDWNPRKSTYKTMIFPCKEYDYKKVNLLPQYVDIVKCLRQHFTL